MAHKKEFISTGGGFSVLNNGVKTEVIAQDGTIKGDIKVTTAKINDAAVTATKLSYEVVEVKVLKNETTGTGTVTAGSIILGCYPTSNQDQFIDSVAVSGTTVTVTLADAATADNVFNVVLLKA